MNWEFAAAIVTVVAAVGGSVFFMRPVLISDNPPWSNVERVEDGYKELEQHQTLAANRIIARLVAGNMLAMRTRYCEALRSNQQNYALALNESVSSLQNEYTGLMGYAYPLESCP